MGWGGVSLYVFVHTCVWAGVGVYRPMYAHQNNTHQNTKCTACGPPWGAGAARRGGARVCSATSRLPRPEDPWRWRSRPRGEGEREGPGEGRGGYVMCAVIDICCMCASMYFPIHFMFHTQFFTKPNNPPPPEKKERVQLLSTPPTNLQPKTKQPNRSPPAATWPTTTTTRGSSPARTTPTPSTPRRSACPC